MKILVVSLLRLGDFIQILPVVSGLKRKHPGARVDVLTFKGTAALKPLCVDVDDWVTLDRDLMQKGLGTATVPMLTSFAVLRETLDGLCAAEYDLVINVTQTKFSAYITGYLRAKSRLGLAITAKGPAHFHSPWFRYLDQHADNPVDDVFNYTDIHCEGAGLIGMAREFALKPTAAGVQEVAGLGLAKRTKMVCQVLTSDSKKNWGESAWCEFLARVHRERPDLELILLGATNERDSLAQLRTRLLGEGVPTREAILSLDGALALLMQAEILVSGDTSIKHLANAAGCKVVELALGSSDVRRTGIYKEDALILDVQMACGPCPHSAPCSQASHACAERLPAASVARAALSYLAGDWQGVKAAIAQPVRAFRTRHLKAALWWPAAITNEDATKTVEQLVRRAAWLALLNRDDKAPLSPMGSAGFILKSELAQLLEPTSGAPVLAHLDFLEKERERDQQTAERELESTGKNLANGHIVDLTRVRGRQIEISEAARKAGLERKLIQQLKSQLMRESL